GQEHRAAPGRRAPRARRPQNLDRANRLYQRYALHSGLRPELWSASAEARHPKAGPGSSGSEDFGWRDPARRPHRRRRRQESRQDEIRSQQTRRRKRAGKSEAVRQSGHGFAQILVDNSKSPKEIRGDPCKSVVRKLPLSQIKKQNFGVLSALDAQRLFFADRRAVALTQLRSIQLHCAACHLQPAVTSRAELVRHFLARLEQ